MKMSQAESGTKRLSAATTSKCARIASHTDLTNSAGHEGPLQCQCTRDCRIEQQWSSKLRRVAGNYTYRRILQILLFFGQRCASRKGGRRVEVDMMTGLNFKDQDSKPLLDNDTILRRGPLRSSPDTPVAQQQKYIFPSKVILIASQPRFSFSSLFSA